MKNVKLKDLQGVDITYNGISKITVPLSSGGTTKFYDISDTTATAADVHSGKDIYLADGTKASGNYIYSWIGDKPEFVKQLYSLDTTLDQTAYATWTPSTTATSMVASQTLGTKETMDLANYDYIIYWVSDCNVAYDNTWTPIKATCLREMCVYTQSIFKRPASVQSLVDEDYYYNATQQDAYACYYCKYYSSASAISLAYTTYSPAYISSVTAHTFSSTSSDSPTVTIKTPVISARCSSSYFSTAQAAKVDQENTTLKMKGYLYRVPAGTCASRQLWSILVDTYNNPL